MITGVEIGGVNTLTQYGLMLLSDLKIGSPAPKTVFVDVPGRSGKIDLSYVVSGGDPVYDDREITFTLFKSEIDSNLDTNYNSLCALCHGQRKTLKLPIDSSHYFRGLFSIGERSGYNSGKIPVIVQAEPWFYKNAETVVEKTMTGTSLNVTLANEMKPVSPQIETDKAITITFGGTQYSVPVGTYVVDGIKLAAGNNTLQIAGQANTNITFTYQEARL